MLKRTLVTVALLGLLVAMPGCKSKEEALADDMVDAMNDMLDVVKDIKDADSAKAALPKLKEIGEKGEKLGKEFNKAMADLPKEERRALDERMEKDMESIMEQLAEETKRLQKDLAGCDPSVLAELGQYLR